MKSKIITSVRLLGSGQEYKKNNNKLMSKTLKTIVLTILLCTITANAQITKGNWMVGGTGSFSYSKTESKNNPGTGTTINYTSNGYFKIALEPNIGYFLVNRLAIGCKLNYLNAFEEGEKLKTDAMNLSIGPYIRYYFLKDDKMYNLFIEPSFNKFLSNSLGNATSFSIKSGFVIFMNSSVGLETSISYIKTTSLDFERNEVFLGLGFQIHLEKDK